MRWMIGYMVFSIFGMINFAFADGVEEAWIPDRSYKVFKYEITVEPIFLDSSIRGNVVFYLTSLPKCDELKFDLYESLAIDSIVSGDDILPFERKAEKVLVDVRDMKSPQWTVYYDGRAKIAVRPPWDGGVVYASGYPDAKPWFSTACQGVGAHTWFPCKDVDFEEPDSGVIIHVIHPSELLGVSNGRYVSTHKYGDRAISTYHVTNPINLYNVHVSIGDYVVMDSLRVTASRAQRSTAEDTLNVTYALLRRGAKRKKKYLDSVTYTVLDCFEDRFGKYPFYEDGYKIIETPFLGMEHQSAIAYGNGFKHGYRGKDLSNTGVGLGFDFIVVHESAHEWWGNSVTAANIADMWIHEAFACYAETVYAEWIMDKNRAFQYCRGEWLRIKNDQPITGNYLKETAGSGDMYYKGAAVIHMIRMMINNDQKFYDMLREIQHQYYHEQVSAEQIENLIIQSSGLPLYGFWEVYLRTTAIPELEFRVEDDNFIYQWKKVNPNFFMRLKVWVDGQEKLLDLMGERGVLSLDTSPKNVSIDPNYLIKITSN